MQVEISGETASAVQDRGSFSEILAKATFCAYLFFVIFGTSMPFQDPLVLRDLDNVATSNVINQIVYSTLFLAAMVSLIPRIGALVALIKREKFLTLFLIWALLTILWSDYPFTSIKRWIQNAGGVIICASVLVHLRSADEALKYLKLIFCLYIPLTLLSIALVPDALDPQFGTWRGLATSKNTLGQLAVASVLVWTTGLRNASFFKKAIAVGLLLTSVVLVIGSWSGTALVTLAVLAGFAALVFFEKYLVPPGVVGFLTTAVIATGIVLFGSISVLAPELLHDLLGAIGKDPTFTGRNLIWQLLIQESKTHLLVGAGFGGFWIIGHAPVAAFMEIHYWFPVQGHQGYLDLLNETGLIGLGLFVALAVHYFIDLARLNKPHFWKWPVSWILLVNFQETTLFQQHYLLSVLFVLSYLALYVELAQATRAGDPSGVPTSHSPSFSFRQSQLASTGAAGSSDVRRRAWRS